MVRIPSWAAFWTFLDHFGPSWTILDHFGPHLGCCLSASAYKRVVNGEERRQKGVVESFRTFRRRSACSFRRSGMGSREEEAVDGLPVFDADVDEEEAYEEEEEEAEDVNICWARRFE